MVFRRCSKAAFGLAIENFQRFIVRVDTPAGKIPWNEVSRISDDDMKMLMQEVVNKTYSFLMNMDNEAFLEKSFKYSKPYTKKWDKAEYQENF